MAFIERVSYFPVSFHSMVMGLMGLVIAGEKWEMVWGIQSAIFVFSFVPSLAFGGWASAILYFFCYKPMDEKYYL